VEVDGAQYMLEITTTVGYGQFTALYVACHTIFCVLLLKVI
jgi:hypothetical protein